MRAVDIMLSQHDIMHTCTCTLAHLHMHSHTLAHLDMHMYSHTYTLAHAQLHTCTHNIPCSVILQVSINVSS